MADAGSKNMDKALNYWGRKYAKTPNDKAAALNYAKNLKASGDNKQAYRVLQQASAAHGNDREIASEYGRLALEAGQVQLASKLLALADDRTSPDWRIVSGRGAALAKLGKYGLLDELSGWIRCFWVVGFLLNPVGRAFPVDVTGGGQGRAL
jgi:Flp pilus assembly protein TadD